MNTGVVVKFSFTSPIFVTRFIKASCARKKLEMIVKHRTFEAEECVVFTKAYFLREDLQIILFSLLKKQNYF